MTDAEPLAPSNSDLPPTDSPRLRRSSTDRMLAGVAGGLADYSGVDVVLWRLGFVALTLAGGSGVLLYALLFVLMPAQRPDAELTGLDRLAGRLNQAVRDTLGPRDRRS